MKIETLMTEFKSRCAYCGVKVHISKQVHITRHPHAATRDHVISRSNKGERSPKNQVLACYQCNQDKSHSENPLLFRKTHLWRYIPKGYKLLSLFGCEIIIRRLTK